MMHTTRRRVRWATALVLVAAVVTIAAQSPQDQVQSFFTAYDEAFNARDIDRLGTMYHADVTVFEGGGIDRTWASYRDNHLGPELRNFKDLVFAHSNVVVHVLGPDAAYVTAEYSISYTTGERKMDGGGIATHVLVRGNGAWTIRHSQTASRRRPAGGS